MGDAAESQMIFQALSEGDTDRLGAAIASFLEPGDILALNGELGAGKTRLVRAIVRSCCADHQPVSSPTYVLLKTYAGAFPIFHFDAYRLADVDEFLELGAEEFLAGEGVCIIEWAHRVEDALPADHLRIDIRASGPRTREFQLTASRDRSIALMNQIASHVRSTTES